MPRLLLACLAAALLAACSPTRRASAPAPAPPRTPASPYADLSFLAADALLGRRVGTPGNDTAAAYVARVLAKAGARPLPGQSSIYLPVALVELGPVDSATLAFDGQPVTASPFTDALLPISRAEAHVDAPVVYIAPEAFADLDPATVRGKAVVSRTGTGADDQSLRAFYDQTLARRAQLAAAGAAALVEAYVPSPNTPFARLASALNQATVRLRPAPGTDLPAVWIRADTTFQALREGRPDAPATLQLTVAGAEARAFEAPNVVAALPGTDPALADEYVLASAHFDHIGVSGTTGDTINNGARDNAMGTAALLAVARAYGANPGRRPLLIAAWNAEEMGLLGSEAFAADPPLPLDQIFFNFNMDGAGYDDTTAVTLNGYGFTDLQPLIDSAIQATGLSPKPDPVPEYDLFRASDNWSLAKRGVPAVNMAPGFTGFNEELMRYYHQPADETAAVDPAYLERYAAAAVAAVRALSDVAPGTAVAFDPGD